MSEHYHGLPKHTAVDDVRFLIAELDVFDPRLGDISIRNKDDDTRWFEGLREITERYSLDPVDLSISVMAAKHEIAEMSDLAERLADPKTTLTYFVPLDDLGEKSHWIELNDTPKSRDKNPKKFAKAIGSRLVGLAFNMVTTHYHRQYPDEHK